MTLDDLWLAFFTMATLQILMWFGWRSQLRHERRKRIEAINDLWWKWHALEMQHTTMIEEMQKVSPARRHATAMAYFEARLADLDAAEYDKKNHGGS